MAQYKAADPLYDPCENCGTLTRSGSLCGSCGVRNSDSAHTHMARSVRDESANFAVASEQISWAEPRSTFDVPPWAHKESVYATLRACDLPFNERV